LHLPLTREGSPKMILALAVIQVQNGSNGMPSKWDWQNRLSSEEHGMERYFRRREGERVSDKNLTLHLHTASNTAVPCLQALITKGYVVSHYFLDLGNEKCPQWAAEKDARLFTADRLEELLGLVTMWEVRGDDWRLKDGEYERYEELVQAAPTAAPRPRW
jgi:hypothetical protein